MQKHLILALSIVFTISSYSQITFEKGYYINESDQKTECLIKNMDWKNNPTSFKYKLSENSEIMTVGIATVTEFGVHNNSKYIRRTVDIDRSSDYINDLSVDRNPKFEKEQLFLKVLVEGKSNLYGYEDGNLKRFFFNVDNSGIEQLIFKSYKTTDGKIAKNVGFKQQLLNNLNCDRFKFRKIENLKYRKKSLIPFFIDYNNCINSDVLNYEKKVNENLFHLNLRIGLNSSSLSFFRDRFFVKQEIDFGNKLSFRLGAELEYTLGFNNKKWAVIIEPNYQYYKTEKTVSYNNDNQAIPQEDNYKIDYKSIQVPLGLRHYFFLNKNSKLFINSSLVFGLSLNSSLSVDQTENFIKIKKITNNFAFGGGYKYNDKYSLELRYNTDNGILAVRGANASDTNFGTLSFILGYQLF